MQLLLHLQVFANTFLHHEKMCKGHEGVVSTYCLKQDWAWLCFHPWAVKESGEGLWACLNSGENIAFGLNLGVVHWQNANRLSSKPKTGRDTTILLITHGSEEADWQGWKNLEKVSWAAGRCSHSLHKVRGLLSVFVVNELAETDFFRFLSWPIDEPHFLLSHVFFSYLVSVYFGQYSTRKGFSSMCSGNTFETIAATSWSSVCNFF